MGAVCSGETRRRIENGEDGKIGKKKMGFSGKLKSTKSLKKRKENVFSSYDNDDSNNRLIQQRYDSGELKLSYFSSELKPSRTPSRTAEIHNKVCQKSSFLGKAGLVGLEVLDTLGSSVSNLNAGSGFVSGMAARGNKISILAFEVANTIAKGSSLLQSVSDENIQFLKKDVLHSEVVQLLVSTDMNELLSIAAADKREELCVFSREVVRFGNLCKDPQWHKLGRYFSNLDSEYSTQQHKEGMQRTLQDLSVLAQYTSELYHEQHALERFEQDYQRKLDEMDSLNLPRKGDCVTMLLSELKQQRKIVRSLKKKSLWSRNLDEIIEKLVDIVTYIDHAITESFGISGATLNSSKETTKTPQTLGAAGLALHYANLINQIDNIASRPTSLPPNMRDTLYNGLPASVKTALRSKVQNIDTKEELSVSQIKNEMEKTLHWLVPVATNTNKAHQGFGWVGEWANTGSEFGRSKMTSTNLTRLQTLYHADKQKTDAYILELITQLHQLISLVRNRDHGLKTLPIRYQTYNAIALPPKKQFLAMFQGAKTSKPQISEEDKILLANVCNRKLVPGLSKSQEFPIGNKESVTKARSLNRSAGNSPVHKSNKRRKSLESLGTNLLDVMDGLGPSC